MCDGPDSETLDALPEITITVSGDFNPEDVNLYEVLCRMILRINLAVRLDMISGAGIP